MSPRCPPPAPSAADARSVVTDSADATRRLAARLAGVAEAGDVIALFGDLGAGKTQFAKGFAEGLGVDGDGQLAELRPDGRVRRPPPAVPSRPLSPGRRGRGDRRRAHRRAPGGRASPSSSGPSGSGRRSRPTGSTSGSTGPATSPGRSVSRRRARVCGATSRRAVSTPSADMVAGDAPAERGSILVFDTATTLAVVGLGRRDGRLLAEATWTAGYRHGEELLARIDGVLAEAGVGLDALGAIVVGTGPGAFTGLRVGLATAKGLAHGLGIAARRHPDGSGAGRRRGRGRSGDAAGGRAPAGRSVGPDPDRSGGPGVARPGGDRADRRGRLAAVRARPARSGARPMPWSAASASGPISPRRSLRLGAASAGGRPAVRPRDRSSPTTSRCPAACAS